MTTSSSTTTSQPTAAAPAVAGRPSTSATPNPDGSVTITIHRHCNGCGRDLGDATAAEVAAADAGEGLADVRAECGCAGPLDSPTTRG